MEWGLCATLKAPVDQVRAFVAHHLGLGAAHLWLFFDDPDDPAFDAVAGLDRVTATRCDMAYWTGLINKRPDRHQNRQGRNMQAVYKATSLPWLGHIDVDEYLAPSEEIGAVLARHPADRPMYRMAPWEALHDPALPDDIFTARQFRAALSGADRAGARERVFGPFAPLLPQGVLSHSAGKCFFRTGLARFEPRLHGAFRAGARVPGGEFGPEIALLHFHAEDPARWKDRLQFRLERGAYSFNEPLRQWLLEAGPAGIDGFYDAVQRVTPALVERLRAEAALLEADLGLRAQVAARFGA
ncbi:MAG: glycosyltransferase family 2 protein [Pseudorhodobacter sp.]